MQNLAGRDPDEATAVVLAELPPCVYPEARVVDKRFTEVYARYNGVMRFKGGRVVRFERMWCYWSVRCEPPIPAPDCHEINEREGDFGGTKYSGRVARLGSVVRAFTNGGGMDRAEIDVWISEYGDAARGVDSYHVDTPEGLAAFVDELRRLYGEPLMPEACAGAEVRRG